MRKWFMKSRGRLAALFVLVSVAAALGLSTIASAERQKSSPQTVKAEQGSVAASVATSLIEETVEQDSLTSTYVMRDLKSAGGERSKEEKSEAKSRAKRRGSAAPSRVRSRAAKNNSKGSKGDGPTKVPRRPSNSLRSLNPLGQIVYSVPATNFDVSHP
jgi:hypothetical protein